MIRAAIMTKPGACLIGIVGFAAIVARTVNAGDTRPITPEERSHWAFVAPVRSPVPKPSDPGWVRNPIDGFIASTLDANALRPAVQADPTTLLRRLSFDVTGLPPTLSELERFLNDPAPDAYERQVDRLLASPHRGERLAQWWLDLARYADTDGFEFDQARPDAWRFRDWVTRAFNADLPYDRFVTLQLAGDEVAPEDAAAFIATGFNRCYPDMVDLNDQGLRRQNALNDITETTGLVFLGLTIGCARCHDHKFDPIRLTDFYRLQAFFTPARFRDDYPVVSASERQAFERRSRAWREQVAEAQSALIALESATRERLAKGPPPGLDDLATAAFQKPAADRSTAEVQLAFDALTKDKRIKLSTLENALDPAQRDEDRRLRDRLKRLASETPPELPHARGLDEDGPNAPPTYVRLRGDYANPGTVVEPGIPAVFDDPRAGVDLAVHATGSTSGRRTALAAWLTSKGNPLTARVIVNRLWQQAFGRGIVGSSSDFGTVGDGPSHPELLDWLATELVRQTWDIKAIQRLILTSATYRQSTTKLPAAEKADPENLLLSHQNRRRLDGEAIRDALLAVSGRLDQRLGGPCVFPELPVELTKLSSKGAIWPVSPEASDRVRRSLYVFTRRNLRYPFFEAFDRPDTNASCPRRPVTTIAPQALTLFNGALTWACAQALSQRVEAAVGAGPDARIRHAYLLALGRPPDAEEQRMARGFIAGHDGDEAWNELCLALLNLNEFIYVD